MTGDVSATFLLRSTITILHAAFFSEESIEADEEEFARMMQKKASDGGKVKVVDVSKKESEIEVKEIVTLGKVIENLKAKFPGLNHLRIPICNSASPLEKDFDTLCGILLGTNVNCPVIVNCQVSFFRIKESFVTHRRETALRFVSVLSRSLCALRKLQNHSLRLNFRGSSLAPRAVAQIPHFESCLSRMPQILGSA